MKPSTKSALVSQKCWWKSILKVVLVYFVIFHMEINVVDNNGLTPLFVVIQHYDDFWGDISIVQYLLDHGNREQRFML